MLDQDTLHTSSELASNPSLRAPVAAQEESSGTNTLKVRLLLGFIGFGLAIAAGGAVVSSQTSLLGETVNVRSEYTAKTHAYARGQGLAGQMQGSAKAFGKDQKSGGNAPHVAPSSVLTPSSLEPVPEVIHTIHTGGTLKVVGQLYGIPEDDLIALNPSISPGRELGPGQRVRIYSKDHTYSDLGSVDRSKDHLYNGVPFWDGPGRTIRRRSRSWGTLRTVRTLDTALNAYAQAFPDGPAIIVSDLSRRHGGKLRPHHGHREGRDVDLSYIPKPRHDNGGFLMMNKRVFDVERNWTFYKALLDTGNVHKVLMDKSLQKLLYDHALAQGVSKAELRTIFQYPRPETKKAGIIQHWANHRDHVHIRFKP